MGTRVNLTMLMAAGGQQMAAVKETAEEVRKILKKAKQRTDDEIGDVWVEFKGANGRTMHLRADAWQQIAIINEVIVVDENAPQNGKEILLARPVDPMMGSRLPQG